MELRQIKELMSAMGRTGTKKLTLKKEDFELTIEREENGSGRFITDQGLEYSDENLKQLPHWNRADHDLPRGSEMPAVKAPSPVPHEPVKVDLNSVYVTSPMVGTYYNAPSPDDSPFIKVGDKVEKGTVVCIIEAMKVMNEIKANVTGIVAEALLETGQPVEFGTKLFRITE